MRYENIKIINEYAKYCINKQSNKLNNDDWKQIAVNVFKDNVKPLHFLQCKRRLNMPEIQKAANNRIMQLLDEQGIVETEGIDTLKLVKEFAVNDKNAKLLLDYAKYLNELRGLAPNKTVITESRSYNSDLSGINNTIDRAISDKRKVTISTTVNNSDKLANYSENESTTNEC